MSKLSNKAKEINKTNKSNTVVNYMGGINYILSPLTTLKMITASSIFGEPQFYNSGMDKKAYVNRYVKEYLVFDDMISGNATEIMTKAIDDALSYDFKGTLDFAVELRKEFYMRLNPQVFMVRASMHKDRVKFNQEYPGYFRQINLKVMSRMDEPATQLAYYIYANGSKNNLPTILKRSWAEKYENGSRYELSKYKNSGLGIINTVRVCHATSDIINELMKSGGISVSNDEKTWEQLRSEGKTWNEILNDKDVYIPHMALLRNLRGIFKSFDESSNEDKLTAELVLDTLKAGVKGGKQFPFRYYTAYKMIKQSNLPFSEVICSTLEECLMKSRENMPSLKGKTMILTDNSGSAHGAYNSEYGSVRIAEINNLSAILTAMNSDDGYIGVFGDKLEVFKVDKDKSVFEYMEKCEKIASNIGMATECGIWLFFKQALNDRTMYDHIFIYSDMQAGHGELYVTADEIEPLNNANAAVKLNYVNVMKLVENYREKVNPIVNVYTVQTNGYKDSLLPEYCYRTAILSGWTGKEVVFAEAISKLWDTAEAETK